MSISHQDQLLLQRHLDGELDTAAATAFGARLAAEPELARAAADAAALRRGFAAARRSTLRPSPSFTAGVLAAVRQLPSRQQLEQADVAASAGRLCRRLLLAAALLAGLGFAWQAGLVGRSEPATLQAAPDPGEVLRVIQELDAMPTPPRATAADAAGASGR